ncbi:hypothetical protein BYT27DRAFT_7340120 [Phlegmacium glaucopus]|nr:hypothetical protein BYT27DRAFT_7340120 [Phlegmacium glaucopus]
MQDGHVVARSSDVIIYSVEAEFIYKMGAEHSPFVAGQTSVKAPEQVAFEKHLPESPDAILGPTVTVSPFS